MASPLQYTVALTRGGMGPRLREGENDVFWLAVVWHLRKRPHRGLQRPAF